MTTCKSPSFMGHSRHGAEMYLKAAEASNPKAAFLLRDRNPIMARMDGIDKRIADEQTMLDKQAAIEKQRVEKAVSAGWREDRKTNLLHPPKRRDRQ